MHHFNFLQAQHNPLYSTDPPASNEKAKKSPPEAKVWHSLENKNMK